MMNRKRNTSDFKNEVKRKLGKLEELLAECTSSDEESDDSSRSMVSSKSVDLQNRRSDEPENTSWLENNTPAPLLENRSERGPTEPDALESLLGENPSSNNTMMGPQIATELAVRWESYLASGLDKDNRKALLETWKTPINCARLNAPLLNPETKALLSEKDIKKDKYLQNLQDMLGKGISATGYALTKIIEQRETIDPTITQALVDSGKMFTDLCHTLSEHRKFQLKHYFTKTVQKIISEQKTDVFLFGSDFSRKCKKVKTMEKGILNPGKNQDQRKTIRHFNCQRPNFKPKSKSQEGGRGNKYASLHHNQSRDSPQKSKKRPESRYRYQTKNWKGHSMANQHTYDKNVTSPF